MGEYINTTYLRELSGNDETFLSAVTQELNSHIDQLLENLPQHAAKGEYDAIQQCAHKFRSVLLYLGNPTLANRLKIIEQEAVEKSPDLPQNVNSFCDTLKAIKAELTQEL